MLRWLSFFGAIALVAVGVVYYIYGGPPPTPITAPPHGVERKPDAAFGERLVEAHAPQPVGPSQVGPWSGEVAVNPRVVISGARLLTIDTQVVPSMQDGQILFLGTE